MAVTPILLSVLATTGMAAQGGSDCLRLSPYGSVPGAIAFPIQKNEAW